MSHEDEEALILQRAVFAAFGLTDSPWALFARDANVRPIQTWGLPAPVLFNRPLSMPDLTAPVPGGVFVLEDRSQDHDRGDR